MIPEGESGVVFSVGDSLVLKMCPPLWSEKIDIEKEALLRASRSQIPVAKMEGAGELEGWKYLLMQRLPGKALDRCWQDIPHRDKELLVNRIGMTVKVLHSASPGRLPHIVEDWESFVRRQVKTCVERNEGSDVRPILVRQIPDYVAQYTTPNPEDRSLLHTEMTLGVWRVDEIGGAWQIVGLLDFGDALYGDPHAEFFATYHSDLQRAYYRGYGLDGRAEIREFQNRLLANFLLHRYVNLEWLFRRDPDSFRAETLEQLASELLG